jgi:hypothetical protein
MSDESLFWKVLSLVVILLTAFVPAYVAYDLYSRGPSPEKHIELERVPTIDALRDISQEGIRVKLTLNEQPIDNLSISSATIKNAGSVPVLPIDYHEKLSVSVNEPWKIINVNNSYPKHFVQLHWKRVNDTKFEAEPALLNPGDIVSTKVYLTNTKFGAISILDKASEPQVTWSVRIVNLPAFYEPPSFLERVQGKYFGFEVNLSGWGLPFTIVAALLFQALYLHLLSCAGFLNGWNWRVIAVILCVSLLSFAAAESSATYLFGNIRTEIQGVQHWANAPFIMIHILVLCFLYRKARKASACR